MSKHRSKSPIKNAPINNQAEPKVSVHSPISYITQHSGWRRIREEEQDILEQIAQDSQ